ncbi:hypothetical protein GH5_05939 [Leishmania sp. Ghana 2012 LV757]|uniref:hypothetical protein n=1 Tax=Leishmania sp. Ghana 2012 LV757 TaxID=2803181 RepID=UPI001B7A061D|nr:hypothetical protein GH5_05939 [Leishmania sp. Ghana 2012 LV757]
MSLSAELLPEEGVLSNAQKWETLAKYEQAEAVHHLLKRISGTCLRHGHLRVIEREEFVCYGVHADASSSTRRLLLYGRVRHCHREALLALVRQIRLHSVRDLDTVVTAGLQAGDLVPHVLLEPLTPCRHTTAYVLWYRVYCAMRCGIFRTAHVRQKKMKHRLHQLIHEAVVTSLDSEKTKYEEAGGGENTLMQSSEKQSASGHANTLHFYTQEFGHLFGKNAIAMKDQSGADGSSQSLALKNFMTAARETRVSLVCLASTVPSVFVAWSCRYPNCMDWLQRLLFNDSHLQEMLNETGLSGRYAVLLDKDPWLSFAAEHGDVLPRLPTKEAFRIELLQPLPKRAQIVLLNVDEDAAEAGAAFQNLKGGLRGWKSPEVDLLSLWCGREGLQSEVATLFHIEKLPFIVETRPGRLSGWEKVPSRMRLCAYNSRRPVVVRSSRDTFEVSKDMYDVADTPKVRRRRGEADAPTPAEYEDSNTWHNLTAQDRAGIAGRLSTYIAQRRLPLCFTAFIGREYVICNPHTSDPWKAVECVASSSLKLIGDYVTGHDLMPVATELRQMRQLDGFEFRVKIMEPSAPLTSSLEWATPQLRREGKMHVAMCAHCRLLMDVDAVAHVRCLHCPSKDKSGILCEACALTAQCHLPQHILLRIPAGVWTPSLPLLWGPSNIAPLAVLSGRNQSKQLKCHRGIYCNRCRMMIRGTRWKCARCYQYDLCDTCARICSEREAFTKSRPNTGARGGELLFSVPSSPSSPRRPRTQATPVCSEDATHPMLFIPYAHEPNANSLLQPVCSANLDEWLCTR